jgi:hypothetical protein
MSVIQFFSAILFDIVHLEERSGYGGISLNICVNETAAPVNLEASSLTPLADSRVRKSPPPHLSLVDGSSLRPSPKAVCSTRVRSVEPSSSTNLIN